jgi:hypothetical protein
VVALTDLAVLVAMVLTGRKVAVVVTAAAQTVRVVWLGLVGKVVLPVPVVMVEILVIPWEAPVMAGWEAKVA